MKYLMKYLQIFVVFGWAFPLFVSIQLLSEKIYCTSLDRLCSFPFLETVNVLLLVSMAWLCVSIIVYVRTQR